MRISRLIDNILLYTGLAGILLILGGLLYLNRFTIFSWVQSTQYQLYDTEKAAEKFADGQQLYQKHRSADGALGLDFDRMILACRIYNLLDPRLYGEYKTPWSEKQAVWSGRAWGLSFDNRVSLPRNYTPDDYWSGHQPAAAEILKLWSEAFRYGGKDIRYPSALAKAALALCRPGTALNAWAGFISRYETIIEHELTERKKEELDLHEVFISSADITEQLATEADYFEALNSYLHYYNLYDRSIRIGQATAFSSKAPTKGRYAELEESIPREALQIVDKRMQLEQLKPTTERNHIRLGELSCRRGNLLHSLATQGANYHIVDKKEIAALQVSARLALGQCLNYTEKYPNGFLSFKAHLELSELAANQGDRPTARFHLTGARQDVPAQQIQDPYLREYYRNRLDRLEFLLYTN